MRSSRDSGFSLAEALVALALIATVAGAFVPALAAAARLQRESAIVTQAIVIAGNTLESLRHVAAEGVLAGGDATTFHGQDGSGVPADDAVYESRTRIWPIPGVERAWAIAIEVRLAGARTPAVNFTAVVPDG